MMAWGDWPAKFEFTVYKENDLMVERHRIGHKQKP